MKIDVPLNTWCEWKVVQGEIVDVAPHLAATFVLHDGRPVQRQRWEISDAESGCHIASCETKAETMSLAKAYLASKSQRDVEKAWKRARKDTTRVFSREAA